MKPLAFTVVIVLIVPLSNLFGTQDDTSEAPRGVIHRGDGIAPGYTLLSPFGIGDTYLIDEEGRVLHQWHSEYEPGLSPYLLPDGHLLRGIQMEVPARFEGGGQSGGVQLLSWDGELLWEYHFANDNFYHHHDIEPLPNGNLLLIAWEKKSQQEALAAGRLPDWCGERGMWPGFVVEIEPLPPYGARVVWEWHAWDHLIQDLDPSLPNYGTVWERPERININGDVPRGPADGDQGLSSEELAGMEALGYLTGDTAELSKEEKRRRERADWLHFNGIDYHAELDQIVLSSWHMNEIWIIDHSTTTAEAASSAGGRSGRGGDLLYRWGNPQTYQLGAELDRQLFHQHDPQWIPEGFPGAGRMTIFNNGRKRPDEEYSTVLEIATPLLANGRYEQEPAIPFGPERPVWEYNPDADERFYASFISGCHRLANGNTLICEGPAGRVFEVNSEGAIVWEYLNPYGPKPMERDQPDRRYAMFRATRIPPDHPGLAGRDLAPLDPQPPTLAQQLANQPAPLAASGWQELLEGERGLSSWIDVNVADDTFEMQPNPDNDDEWILVCSGKPTGLLRSNKMYENFILEVEWRHMEEPGNAGLFVWADPLPAVGGPFTRGIEIQICNLGDGSWFTSHGDIFPIWGATMTPDPRFRISNSRSMPNADALHANPTGEWNHYRITAVDGALTLEVNGHLVTAGSQCNPKRGYLCLESEGGEVHFRNMRIWPLPNGSNPALEAATADSAGPWRTLYNGRDLDNLEVLQGDWLVQDWQLTSKAMDSELKVKLPNATKSVFFDFRRDQSTEFLPFSFGGKQFPSEGEQAGKWNRVHLEQIDEDFTVKFAGLTHSSPTTENADLIFINQGIATSFCSIFVQDV